jgi:pimeloyl-ACP methyl ester carboxylesterase
VGYSLGSLIALDAATRDGRVTGVFAGGLAMDYVDPEPLPPDREAYCDQLAAEHDDDVTDPQAQQVRAWDRSQGLDPRARAALIRGLRLPRHIDWDAVRVPTLVVTGRDEPAPDSLVERLPDARGARVDGDHSSALDDPALAALIVEFLAGIVQRGIE